MKMQNWKVLLKMLMPFIIFGVRGSNLSFG